MKKITTIFLILFAASLSKVNGQVTKLTLSLDSAGKTGECPQVLKFKLQMMCSSSGTATLVWRKSDNTTQTVSNTGLKSGVNTFFYDWKIAGNFSGYISVLVNSSDHKESNTVNFKVTCK